MKIIWKNIISKRNISRTKAALTATNADTHQYTETKSTKVKYLFCINGKKLLIHSGRLVNNNDFDWILKLASAFSGFSEFLLLLLLLGIMTIIKSTLKYHKPTNGILLHHKKIIVTKTDKKNSYCMAINSWRRQAKLATFKKKSIIKYLFMFMLQPASQRASSCCNLSHSYSFIFKAAIIVLAIFMIT